MESEEIKIIFKDNKQSFISGDAINGHVLINFNKPQKARSKSSLSSIKVVSTYSET